MENKSRHLQQARSHCGHGLVQVLHPKAAPVACFALCCQPLDVLIRGEGVSRGVVHNDLDRVAPAAQRLADVNPVRRSPDHAAVDAIHPHLGDLAYGSAHSHPVGGPNEAVLGRAVIVNLAVAEVDPCPASDGAEIDAGHIRRRPRVVPPTGLVLPDVRQLDWLRRLIAVCHLPRTR